MLKKTIISGIVLSVILTHTTLARQPVETSYKKNVKKTEHKGYAVEVGKTGNLYIGNGYILSKAKQLVGESSSSEIGGGNRSCAVMVSKILPDIRTSSTADMFQQLNNNFNYHRVSVESSKPGDVIISPTDHYIGHVGIIGNNCIYQNNSHVKRFMMIRMTAEQWKEYYSSIRHLPTYVFRYEGRNINT
jgi:hypothetical protein